jgi:hypothetical protein
VQGSGFRVQGTELRLLGFRDSGCRGHSEFRTPGAQGAQGLGLRAQGAGVEFGNRGVRRSGYIIGPRYTMRVSGSPVNGAVRALRGLVALDAADITAMDGRPRGPPQLVVLLHLDRWGSRLRRGGGVGKCAAQFSSDLVFCVKKVSSG